MSKKHWTVLLTDGKTSNERFYTGTLVSINSAVETALSKLRGLDADGRLRIRGKYRKVRDVIRDGDLVEGRLVEGQYTLSIFAYDAPPQTQDPDGPQQG